MRDEELTERMSRAVAPASFDSCEIVYWGDFLEEDDDKTGCAIVADGAVMYSVSFARVTSMFDALESWIDDFCGEGEYAPQPSPEQDPEDESFAAYLERLFAG